MPSVLLIVPQWTPFGEALAHRLVPSGDGKLFVLCPYSAHGVPRALLAHVERGALRIEFGLHSNEKLVAELIRHHQIRTVFLLLSGVDDCEVQSPEGIATRTCAFLRPLCALLECLRRCAVPPTLCARDTSLTQTPSAVVQCVSEASARFSAAHALLHAYAVSYRLNVQIALIEQKLHNAQTRDKAANFVAEIATKEDEKAPIHAFKTNGHYAGAEESTALSCVPYARVLLFGTPAAMQLAESRLRQLVPRGQLVMAKCLPGVDPDEAVEEEIVAHGPSHLVFVHGADEQTRAAWEAGGPPNLRDNVRNNLFRCTPGM
uniref:Cleavage and polyadenylation specificity factor subunit 2 n=1 Tax=Globodera pallida TaxID=36090 RepID=A0A183BJ46_GLOPA